MTVKELQSAEAADPFVGLAHEVRNRLSCVHGAILDVQRALTNADVDLCGLMQTLQEQIDEARARVRTVLVDPAGTYRIRSDAAGSGAFGAPRRAGERTYGHRGVDTEVKPGDSVRAPFAGLFSRIGRCYPDDNRFELVVVKYGPWQSKILYVEPDYELAGQKVRAGQTLGWAQDVTMRRNYAEQGMGPHVHTEIYFQKKLVDPTKLMGLR